MQPVITWNLDWWQRGGPQPQRVPLIVERPDAVWLLQELKQSTFRAIMDSWQGEGVSVLDVYEPARSSWMGCGILVPPGYEVLDAGVVVDLPRPQRALWVRTRGGPLGETTFVTWHTENAASDQPRKMACYRAMHDWLDGRGADVVLGFDANSWLDPVDMPEADPSDRYFEEHDFLGPKSRHGLIDGHRAWLAETGELEEIRMARPEGPLATSYVLSNGVGHRMDRMFASPAFGVEGSTYDYDGAVAAGSDHALHEVVLRR
jgi:hypothetical protein